VTLKPLALSATLVVATAGCGLFSSDDTAAAGWRLAPYSPGQSDDVQTCEETEEIPYDVTLDEPLGDRRMVDGQCLPGGEAETTTLCSTGGIRFPAAPEPTS
jgi:hypothetical protein